MLFFRPSPFVLGILMVDSDPLPRVSAFVLAGGQSRRMGHAKALLDFNGAPLIARVIARVQKVCAEVIIVANAPETYARFLSSSASLTVDSVEGGVRVVADVYPGKGSLGGIYSGLQAAREENALAVACDMPFLNDALLRYLISLAPQADVVIPRIHAPTAGCKGGESPPLQPMHAIYSKRCLEPMRVHLLANDLRIINCFDEVSVRVVEEDEVVQFDPQLLSFFNVNTPEDWEFALALLKAQTDAR